MQKKKLNNQGFSLVAILSVVIVVALVGLSGWYVWHKNHDNKTKTSSTSTNKSTDSTSTKTAADPYEGWKTYTDSTSHYSFKYPADWSVDTTSPGQVNVTSPGQDVWIDYSNPYAHDSDVFAFKAVSIDSLTVGGKALNVVGGVYEDSSQPEYAVTDASTLAEHPLIVGQSGNFPNALRFTSADDESTAVQFRAEPNSTMTAAQAQAWFDTDAAKTALLILKSLTH